MTKVRGSLGSCLVGGSRAGTQKFGQKTTTHCFDHNCLRDGGVLYFVMRTTQNYNFFTSPLNGSSFVNLDKTCNTFLNCQTSKL